MTDFEKYVSEQVSQLVSEYDKIEFRANISERSYSIEFFVSVNGKKMQCYDMIDNGKIDEDEFKSRSKAIANYARNMTDFKKGEINKFAFVFS